MQDPNLSQVSLRFFNVVLNGVQLFPDGNLTSMIQRGFKRWIWVNLRALAGASRGSAQTFNLGADIFLAGVTGRHLGRICHYRECYPRVACLAQHCGRREHLNDDLHVVTAIERVDRCAAS